MNELAIQFENSLPRGTEDIQEAFGVSDRFTVNINVKLPSKFSILLITGESGCGKSTILSKLNVHGLEELPENIPLIKIFGYKNLSTIGLCDPATFCLSRDQLSDGQKARAQILYSLMKYDEIAVDEYLANLDRPTAKATAYAISYYCRKNNKKLIAATANDDIEEYMQPDYTIHGKTFPQKFTTVKNSYVGNPIVDNLNLYYGSKEDYRESQIAELHYRGKYSGGRHVYIFASYQGKQIGVLVTTNKIGTNVGDRITRVVVHPAFRGCGVATRMVRFLLETHANIDVVGSMVKYTHCFANAGMIRQHDIIDKPSQSFVQSLHALGFKDGKWGDRLYCSEICKQRSFREAISTQSGKLLKRVQPGGKHLTRETLEKKIIDNPTIAATALFWLRPRELGKYVQAMD